MSLLIHLIRLLVWILFMIQGLILGETIIGELPWLIPPLIFRHGKQTVDKLHPNLLTLLNNTVKENPSFVQVYFSSLQARNFIQDFYPQYLSDYEALIPDSFRASLFLLLVLHRYGGIYLDLNRKLMSPIRDNKIVNLRLDEAVFVIDKNDPTAVATEFLAFSCCSHPLLSFIIRWIVSNIRSHYVGINAFDITGPKAIGRAITAYYNLSASMSHSFLTAATKHSSTTQGSMTWYARKFRFHRYNQMGQVVDAEGRGLIQKKIAISVDLSSKTPLSEDDGANNAYYYMNRFIYNISTPFASKSINNVSSSPLFDVRKMNLQCLETPHYCFEGSIIYYKKAHYLVVNRKRRKFPDSKMIQDLGYKPYLKNAITPTMVPNVMELIPEGDPYYFSKTNLHYNLQKIQQSLFPLNTRVQSINSSNSEEENGVLDNQPNKNDNHKRKRVITIELLEKKLRVFLSNNNITRDTNSRAPHTLDAATYLSILEHTGERKNKARKNRLSTAKSVQTTANLQTYYINGSKSSSSSLSSPSLSQSFLLRNTVNKQEFIIPDFETLTMLSLPLPNGLDRYFSFISSEQKRKVPVVPALDKALIDGSINAQLEVLLQRATFFVKQPKWNVLARLPLFNPSVVRWYDQWFVGWRTGRYESDLRFQWLNEQFQLVGDKPYDNVPKLGLTWELLEDVRLIPLPAESSSQGAMKKKHLLAFYAFYHFEQRGIVHTASNMLDWDVESRNLSFAAPTFLMIEGEADLQNSKNWMPLITSDGQILLITEISPWKVANYSWFLSLSSSSSTAARQPVKGSKNKIAKTTLPLLQFNSNLILQVLPWRQEFGKHLRGGSNSVRINAELFLTFFHTSVMVRERSVYFLAAMTICSPKSSSSSLFPPFIHSMHSAPIISDELYTGKVVSKHVMYIGFPISLSLLPEEHGKDPVHVLLTMGARDHYGIIVQFNITELIEEMTLVNEC